MLSVRPECQRKIEKLKLKSADLFRGMAMRKKLLMENLTIFITLGFIISLTFFLCISGCEEDTPYILDPGSEPDTYLSPHHSLAWSPDGSMLAYIFDNNYLVVKDIETDELRQLTGRGFYDEPTWSPDSIKIAYSSSAYGIRSNIYTKNADGSTVAERITSDTAADDRPRWSPDGTRIAFHSYRTKSMDIWIRNADGSGEDIAVTTEPTADQNAEWSPDGSRLAFESKRAGNFDVWIVEVGSTAPPVRITVGGASDRMPMWSPDGSKIAFRSDRSGSNGIWVKNADGTGNAVQISTGHPGASMHDWSPDGRWLAFISEDKVFVKSSDGTGGAIEIGDGLELRWSPDGTKLALVAWVENQYEVQIIERPEELR